MKTLQKGFSLIELMIVIAIIGILAAIAIPSYQTYVLKSQMSEVFSFIDFTRTRVIEYLQSSGAANCNNMPDNVTSVTNGALIPYINQVGIGSYTNGCEVDVVGQPGKWGQYAAPWMVVYIFPDSNGAYNWSCVMYKYGAGEQLPFNFDFCPNS